jgi:hypothetical protein
MKIPLIVAIAGACVPLLFLQFAVAGVVNPRLRTDRSVDTRSARTIVRALVKPGMTNEEEALAIFHWLRRVVYHSGPEEPMRHDFNKMINVFGYGSCYMQTHPLSHLYGQVGFPCRDCMHDGHHMIEVFYDGAWHCLDPHMTFYAYNRATPRAIASIKQLQDDPSLAMDAAKEKRTGPAFLICGDSPKWFAGKQGRWVQHDFDTHVGADEEFGAIRLPRGTRYVLTWKTGKFYKPHAFSKDGKTGPYHTCGVGSDRKDTVNWPYWEPYVEGGHGRHYGTGYLEYAPDLRGGGWKDGAIRVSNLVSDSTDAAPGLRPDSREMPGEVIFRVDCPYVITAAELRLKGRLNWVNDTIAISISKEWAGRRRKWQTVARISGKDFSTNAVAVEQDLGEAVAGSMKGYWVRVVLGSKDPRTSPSCITELKLRSDFQLNPYALPQLLPGKNRLYATAARCDGPWKFRIAWMDGEGWKKLREYKATLRGTSDEETIEAAGPKFPRMETIEFSVDP